MGMTQFTAAQHPILAGYSGRQVGEEVRIDFGIKGGASCNGVTLYRTLDDGATYSFVAEIEGVCGGSEFTEFYNLSDASPARNRRNAYRLQLGNQGYSDTLSVLYIPQTSEVLAFPMPFTETLHLQWDAATGEEWLLRIYTLDGRLVVRDIAVRAPRVELPLHELPSGTYVLQLRHPVRGEVLQKRAVKSTFEP
jgi:hypothetical protein